MRYYCDNKRHLVCIPYSIDNLHKMDEDLKIGKHWFHLGKNGKAHYDIPKTRIEEIQAKCCIVSSKTIVEIIKRTYGDLLPIESSGYSKGLGYIAWIRHLDIFDLPEKEGIDLKGNYKWKDKDEV